MPQATEDLRKKWGGMHGVGEDKAEDFLMDKGWIDRKSVWYSPTTTAPSKDEWEALEFLIDEWDHAYGGVQE